MQFWIQASAYLFNFVSADPDLSRLPISDRLKALLLFWKPEELAASLESLQNAALDLSYFGPVGKALWYVNDKSDPQFKKELKRFATNPTSEIGNDYLFYIVGTLAANGSEPRFVPEAGNRAGRLRICGLKRMASGFGLKRTRSKPVTTIDSPENGS